MLHTDNETTGLKKLAFAHAHCKFLHLIFGKSMCLVQNRFLSKALAHSASWKLNTGLTVKNGIFGGENAAFKVKKSVRLSKRFQKAVRSIKKEFIIRSYNVRN